jgi:hypothetical protein
MNFERMYVGRPTYFVEERIGVMCPGVLCAVHAVILRLSQASLPPPDHYKYQEK